MYRIGTKYIVYRKLKNPSTLKTVHLPLQSHLFASATTPEVRVGHKTNVVDSPSHPFSLNRPYLCIFGKALHTSKFPEMSRLFWWWPLHLWLWLLLKVALSLVVVLLVFPLCNFFFFFLTNKITFIKVVFEICLFCWNWKLFTESM